MTTLTDDVAAEWRAARLDVIEDSMKDVRTNDTFAAKLERLGKVEQALYEAAANLKPEGE